MLNAAAIDRAGDGQVVVSIDDFLLAGAFTALFEQLDHGNYNDHATFTPQQPQLGENWRGRSYALILAPVSNDFLAGLSSGV